MEKGSTLCLWFVNEKLKKMSWLEVKIWSPRILRLQKMLNAQKNLIRQQHSKWAVSMAKVGSSPPCLQTTRLNSKESPQQGFQLNPNCYMLVDREGRAGSPAS